MAEEKSTMRRADRALSEEEARAILEQGEYGILSMIDPDGVPYAVPVSYAYDGKTIYIHGANKGRKVSSLKNDPQVSFCVVGKTEVLPDKFSTLYESAVVSGTAEECTGEEKIDALMHIVRKYSPDFLDRGEKYARAAEGKAAVYKITVQSVTGKSRKTR